MAAMFSRSNATSPIPSLNRDIEPGQIPLGVSHFVANQEYSAQQLLDFILEARNQAKTGASPTKIAFNYRFLDAEDAPRFPADIIAEWVDLPASSIPTWIESSARADITVRRGRLSANPSHSPVRSSPGSDLRGTGTPRSGRSIPSRSRSPASTVDDIRQDMAEFQAQVLSLVRAMTPSPPVISDIRQDMAELKAQVSSLVRARTPSPPVISASGSRIAAAMASCERAPAKDIAAALAATSRAQPASPRPCQGEALDALMQQNAALLAELALLRQPPLLVPAQPSRDPPQPRPFKDFMPNLPSYSGGEAPEAFLAQFRTQAHHLSVPPDLLTRQLIAKLTGDALDWFHLHFAGQDATATSDQIAVGLRTAFGQEYAGARAYWDTWHVQTNYALPGPHRLRVFNQKEERARQHRVPLNPGEKESRFCKLLDLFTPAERPRFFSELTANAQCSEKALRQLEESTDAAGHNNGLGPSRASLLEPPSLDREALFALRVELAEAAINRLQPSQPTSRERNASARVLRTDEAQAPFDAPSSGTPRGAPPNPHPLATPSPPPPGGESSQAECRLLQERLAAINGRGFSGPPHYFGDNDDPARKKKNHDEFSRRRSGGLCFKCTQAEVTSCPFLECPRHGAEAVRSGAASGAAAVRRHRQA